VKIAKDVVPIEQAKEICKMALGDYLNDFLLKVVNDYVGSKAKDK